MSRRTDRPARPRLPAADLICGWSGISSPTSICWTGHFPELTRRLVRHLAERARATQQVYPADREAAVTVAVTTLITSLAMNHVYRGKLLSLIACTRTIWLGMAAKIRRVLPLVFPRRSQVCLRENRPASQVFFLFACHALAPCTPGRSSRRRLVAVQRLPQQRMDPMAMPFHRVAGRASGRGSIVAACSTRSMKPPIASRASACLLARRQHAPGRPEQCLRLDPVVFMRPCEASRFSARASRCRRVSVAVPP